MLGARCLVPEGFPGFCFVFETVLTVTSQLELTPKLAGMQQKNDANAASKRVASKSSIASYELH